MSALIPKPGNFMRQVTLGPTSVVVECSREIDGTVIIEGAILNGRLVPYADELSAVFDRWSEELTEDERNGVFEGFAA